MPLIILALGYWLGSNSRTHSRDLGPMDLEGIEYVCLVVSFSFLGLALSPLEGLVRNILNVNSRDWDTIYAIKSILFGVTLGWAFSGNLPAFACLFRLRTALILTLFVSAAATITWMIFPRSDFGNGLLAGLLAAALASTVIIVIRGIRHIRHPV